MRRVVGTFGLVFLMISGSGCFLYFDDDDPEGRPVRDAGVVRADADVPDADPPPCDYPSYSSDCSEVGYFQCGFGAACEGDTVVASWHEHVFCEGYEEQIIDFTCSYACADGCIDGRDLWPEDGAALVAGSCVASGTGSSCAGQCGLALDGCFCDEACVGYDDCCDDYAEQCATCEDLDEDSCKAHESCMPVYTGINCTDPEGNTCTGNDSNCTCESFVFADCEVKS